MTESEFVRWLKEKIFKNLTNPESVLGVSKKTLKRWIDGRGISKANKVWLLQLKEIFIILDKSLSIKQIDDWLWSMSCNVQGQGAQPTTLIMRHYDCEKIKKMANNARKDYIHAPYRH
jgi:hypothetical protein